MIFNWKSGPVVHFLVLNICWRDYFADHLQFFLGLIVLTKTFHFANNFLLVNLLSCRCQLCFGCEEKLVKALLLVTTKAIVQTAGVQGNECLNDGWQE